MARLLLFLVFVLLLSCRGETAAVPVADPLPVKTYSVGNTKIKSYDFKAIEPFLHRENDTTYVVNFWATWCAPCVAELPVFENLAVGNKGDKVG